MKGMKKFKCTVEKTYTYEIEFDETIWNEQALKDWSSVFTDVDDLSELAIILAKYKTTYEAGEFIEGFGIPMINGKEPFVWNALEKEGVNHNININIIEDGEMYVDCEEVK